MPSFTLEEAIVAYVLQLSRIFDLQADIHFAHSRPMNVFQRTSTTALVQKICRTPPFG
jgi:hypothetical protein